MKDNIFVLLLLSFGGIFVLVGSFIGIFIRNQNKLLNQRAQLQQAKLEHQQELLQTIILSQETERKRIGQDLHDDVGTALSNLRIIIELFNQNNAADRTGFAGTSKQLIDKIIQDVRYISHNLSPPGIVLYGFMGALEELTEFITLTGRLQVNIHNKLGTLPDKLDESTSISLYRVMEELLNNTLKHAGASQVDIDLSADGNHMLLSYEDNGCGLPAGFEPGKGMGMQNIESRLGAIGAIFNIVTPGHKGFKLLLRLKLINL